MYVHRPDPTTYRAATGEFVDFCAACGHRLILAAEGCPNVARLGIAHDIDTCDFCAFRRVGLYGAHAWVWHHEPTQRVVIVDRAPSEVQR